MDSTLGSAPCQGRVDGQSFVKALLNVWTPNSLWVTVQSTVRPICHSFSIGAVLLRPSGH
ncbi:hypothetical protein EYF80_007440 [Liparis tanakae]|uniref:Uncharacterized protein n=1 Tax=Liparis tanakae TaxID=230148 RepID=A0A4Z2IWF9_9TELE|nr:hypothetical protein EYF80_007440 [Liparis tanakae]